MALSLQKFYEQHYIATKLLCCDFDIHGDFSLGYVCSKFLSVISSFHDFPFPGHHLVMWPFAILL